MFFVSEEVVLLFLLGVSSAGISISAIELEFTPEFYYTTNNQLGDVISFKDASAGQQATALLTVLLNQVGIPLLIDQPEDDIDNRAVDQIIKNIWEAKKKRQLVFTSHNANLVVNADAEQVIVASNNEEKLSYISGSLEKPEINIAVCDILEGGKIAFQQRRNKYNLN